jgi:nucleoside-diphosphate kinase
MAEESTASLTVEYVQDGLRRTFVLSFFARDGSVSLYEPHTKRMFLRRTVPPESLQLGQLYLGATVVVCSRTLRIVGVADAKTARTFAATRGATLLLVKPDAYQQAGQVLDVVYQSGLSVGRMRMVRFDGAEAAAFLAAGASAAASATTGGGGGGASGAASLTGDNMLAIELAGDDVIARVHELVGPADPADAKAAAPTSLRALFGATRAANGVHTSRDLPAAAAELAFIFERKYPYTAVCTHCAALVIKPHAVEAKAAGKVLDAVLAAGLEVSALRGLAMERADAADFLEPYRTIVPEFERWVKELSSGPCIVAEVRGEAAVERLRELAGPYDPVIAQHLRPGSLRARFGLDNVRNALQVTDVERDGPLECKFLFSVI